MVSCANPATPVSCTPAIRTDPFVPDSELRPLYGSPNSFEALPRKAEGVYS